MKLVIAAALITALNLLTTQLWASHCPVSMVDAANKPVFARVIMESEEDKEKKKKKKKKKKDGSGDDEPDCD